MALKKAGKAGLGIGARCRHGLDLDETCTLLTRRGVAVRWQCKGLGCQVGPGGPGVEMRSRVGWPAQESGLR